MLQPPRSLPFLLAALSVMAYVILAPNLALPTVLGFGSYAAWHDQQRVLQILALVALVGVLAFSPALRDVTSRVVRQLQSRAVLACTVFLGVGAVSAANAEFPRAAFREVGLYSLLMLGILVIAAARVILGESLDRWILVAVMIAVLAYCTAFVAFELTTGRAAASMYGFSHPRFFGQFGLWTWPVLVSLPGTLGASERRPTVLTMWALATLWSALIIESGGRGAAIALLAAVAVVAVLLGRVGRRWAASAGIVALVGTVVWGLIIRPLSAVHGVSQNVQAALERGTGDTGRFAIWREALDMVQHRPFLGVGPEHFGYYTELLGGAHPHNAPLQIASEWGVLAAFLVMAVAAWAYVSRVASMRRDPDNHGGYLDVGLFAAATAAGFESLVDGVIVMPVSQMMLVLIVGVILGRHLRGQIQGGVRDGAADNPGPSRYILATVGLAGAIVVLIGSLPYALDPEEGVRRESRRPQVVEDGTLFPRFWLQGRLFDRPPPGDG